MDNILIFDDIKKAGFFRPFHIIIPENYFGKKPFV